MPVKVSVIVATYNEAQNITGLIKEISGVLKKGYEIIVVDDNSPDGTAGLARKAARAYPVRLIVRSEKLGVASAIMDGAKAAKGKRIVVIDADLSHPPEKLGEFLKENADIVIGSRYIRGGGVEGWPFMRKAQSGFATAVARKLLKVKLTDPMSGFFSVKRSLLLNTKLSVKGFKILLDIVVKNPGASVKEVPYVFVNRKIGESKMGMAEVRNFCAAVLKLWLWKLTKK